MIILRFHFEDELYIKYGLGGARPPTHKVAIDKDFHLRFPPPFHSKHLTTRASVAW